MISRRIHLFWDRMGVTASAICMIHCLALPIFLALLPLTSLAGVLHAWAHPVLLIFIIPSVVFSMYSNRKSRKGNALLFLGLCFLLFAWNFHRESGGLTETMITSAGSLSLIWGHGINYISHKTYRRKIAPGNSKIW